MLSLKDCLKEQLGLVNLLIDSEVNGKSQCQINAEVGDVRFPRQVKKETVLVARSFNLPRITIQGSRNT